MPQYLHGRPRQQDALDSPAVATIGRCFEQPSREKRDSRYGENHLVRRRFRFLLRYHGLSVT